MPLFVCESCGAVENTALTDFWNREHRDGDDKRALCSACRDGKWHGVFPKRHIDSYGDRPPFRLWRAGKWEG